PTRPRHPRSRKSRRWHSPFYPLPWYSGGGLGWGLRVNGNTAHTVVFRRARFYDYPQPMAKSFYIIDGHAQIYRAYFAPFRDLSSPSGEPTKATFVFTQRLLNLVQERKPDYLAMVIDSGDETVFRKEILPAYKANRQARPDDFNPQEQRILSIVRDAGIPIFAKPGFEADDVIATLAKRLCDKGYETLVVSNDKDLRQILNDCTKMYDPW